MKNLICIPLLMMVATLVYAQQPKPEWAFPVTDKVQPQINEDPDKVWTAPGSKLALTRAQIDDRYNTPDWFPEMYPPMPPIIKTGDAARELRACGLCHLPTGTGHDESAYVAGLPVNYFIRQMQDYKSGARKGSGSMITLAKLITDEEIRESAEYYASVKPRPWFRVVETDTVPKSYVGPGNKRLVHPDGGSEPIGNRIVALPEDRDIVLNRDPRAGFVVYVPKGSIERGKELVTTGGGGKTIPCAACHGPTLQGAGDVPPIAGRGPNYIVRQLWSMQSGERTGPSNAMMLPVVNNLTVDDMLAIAAYTGSLAP